MSYPKRPGVPDAEQPLYIQWSHTADRMRAESEALPRWRWLRRKKLRKDANRLSLAAAMSHMSSW